MSAEDREDLLGTKRCCGTSVLLAQPDFSEQKEWLRETVEEAGFNIIFYPKFHCELNFIEMIWGWLKQKCRDRCSYNYNDLKELLPTLLNKELPIHFVRKASRYCFRFMHGYNVGLAGPLLEYSVKKYTSHRTIPAAVISQLEEEYKVKEEQKYKT